MWTNVAGKIKTLYWGYLSHISVWNRTLTTNEIDLLSDNQTNALDPNKESKTHLQPNRNYFLGK